MLRPSAPLPLLLSWCAVAAALGGAPWVPLPPPLSCGAVLQPNNTFCIYLRNNCSNVVSLSLSLSSIPGNSWAVPPAASWKNDTWFSFPSLSLAPNAASGFANYTVNVFYNASLSDGKHHTFGFGCIFSATEFDCSFQPGKHFDAQPDEQLDAPSYLGLLIFDKGHATSRDVHWRMPPPALPGIVPAPPEQAHAAPCPCANATLCRRIAPAPRPEIFMFQVDSTNWPHYDYSALTTIALFGGTGADALAGVCHAHAHNVRAVAEAPLSNDPADLHNETYIDAFIESLLATVNGSTLGVELDGVNFDVEGPLADADAGALTAAVAKTAAAMKRAFGDSFQVSVDVAWSPACIDGRCYDFKGLADASDLLFVMAYDMRSQIKPPAPCIASANSPFPGVQEGLLAFERIGVPASKLVLGLPWYGYRYPCEHGTAPDAAVCPIAHVPFRNVSCSDAAGREFCFSDVMRLMRNSTSRPYAWDADLAAPFFNRLEDGETVQYWFDDPRSLSLKVAYAKAQGLRGVGSWNADCVSYSSSDPVERDDTRSMWAALAAFL